MTNIKKCAHIKAVKDLIEVMSIAFLVGLGVDAVWIIYDISVQGMTFIRAGIAVGLIGATVVTTHALIRYHAGRVKELLHEQLVYRLKHLKRRKTREGRKK